MPKHVVLFLRLRAKNDEHSLVAASASETSHSQRDLSPTCCRFYNSAARSERTARLCVGNNTFSGAFFDRLPTGCIRKNTLSQEYTTYFL
jgi:hypothetical protein